MAKQKKKPTRAEKIAATAEENQAMVSEPEAAMSSQADPALVDAPGETLTVETPALPEGVPGPDQLSQAWSGLLAMATAQGASRGDIIGMTLSAALSITEMTALALWPEGSEVDASERKAFGLVQASVHTLTEGLAGYRS